VGKDKSKQPPKGASPDKLAKTKSKTDIQLTEEELRKASGGAFSKIKLTD
jgi:hypothetical protein